MYADPRVNMSLLPICTKVCFVLRIFVNSPLENFRKTCHVDVELIHVDRPYVSFVILLLKCARSALRITLL